MSSLTMSTIASGLMPCREPRSLPAPISVSSGVAEQCKMRRLCQVALLAMGWPILVCSRPLLAPNGPSEAVVSDVEKAARISDALPPLPPSLSWPGRTAELPHHTNLGALTWSEVPLVHNPSSNLVAAEIQRISHDTSALHDPISPDTNHVLRSSSISMNRPSPSTEQFIRGLGSAASASVDRVSEQQEQPASRGAPLRNAVVRGRHQHNPALPLFPSKPSNAGGRRNKPPWTVPPSSGRQSEDTVLEYPQTVQLPTDVRWAPSALLSQELLSYIEHTFSYSPMNLVDRTEPMGQQVGANMPNIQAIFRRTKHIHVMKLPTRPVLVSIHTTTMFNRGNPLEYSLNLWTIDHDLAQPPVLSLRAVFGIRSALNARLREKPGKAVYTIGSTNSGGPARKILWLQGYH